MHHFQRVLGYLKHYKKTTVAVVISSLFYALFSIVSIGTLAPILNLLFDVKPINIDIPKKNIELWFDASYYKNYLYYQISLLVKSKGKIYVLFFVCLFTIISFFFKNLFRYLSSYFFADMRSGVAKTFRDQLHWKMMNLPVSYFSNKRKGDLISRISADVHEVEWTMLTAIVSIIRNPILFFGTLIALFFTNYQLTLLTLVLLPVSGFIISVIGKKLKRDAKFAQEEVSQLISQVEEALSGVKILKIFNAEKRLQKKFEQSSNANRIYSRRVFRKKDLASPIGEFLGTMTMVVLLLFGGIQVIEYKLLDPGMFMVFIGLFFQMIDPVKKLSVTYYDIEKGNAAAERIFDIIDQEIDLKDKPDAVSFNEFQSKLSFHNVSFAYEKEPVLKRFNLTIKKGETVALVGASGSGKSTIANLFTRFYDVSEGEIQIDGIDIRDIKLTDYRYLIGMVTQDSILFNTSIRENIAIGQKNASEEQIIQAGKIGNAHEFISKLLEGYDTIIGDLGNRLSGGQKQRICIARAVLKNPPIMVLDEATSALDTRSEQLVQEALEGMMKNRTSLVIAHRLSTIKSADRIIVMQDGEIFEQGTHEELIAKNGQYKNLLELQNIE